MTSIYPRYLDERKTEFVLARPRVVPVRNEFGLDIGEAETTLSKVTAVYEEFGEFDSIHLSGEKV